MKRLLLATLFALAVGLGAAAPPREACGQIFCSGSYCTSSRSCGAFCTCLANKCTVFHVQP
jgi:hypothetical protein